jgi:FkbM family methyltransferase
MRTKIIAASKISAGSRWSRLLRNPATVLTPYLMRKLGIRRNISIPTVWGGRFDGVLPEGVSAEIWRSGSFELPVSLTLLHFLKEGGTYVDIGAHFGYFSLLASKLVGQTGRVVSVEAMPSTFGYLKNNVERNGTYKNVSLFQGAAYSERTQLEFRDFGVVASSLNSAFTARDSGHIIKDHGQVVKVEAHKADDIIATHNLKKIDLIKIDAESSEQFVLMGLAKTLKTQKPAIVMEVGDSDPTGNSVEMLLSALAAQDYKPYYWDETQKLLPYIPASFVPYANLVFCHKDARI